MSTTTSSPAARAPLAPPSMWWSRRTWIVVIAFCGMFFATMDQANVNVLFATPAFSRGFALTPLRIGALASIFVAMQAVFNFAFGPLVDWFHARRAALAESVSWAAIMCGTAVVATYPLLFVGRALLGVAEGLRIPVNQRYVKEWFPTFERARANAIWQLGVAFGAAAGVPLTIVLTTAYGWRASFLVFGALSAVVLLPLVLLFGANSPMSVKDVSAAEAEHIAAGLRDEHERTAGLSWRAAVWMLARTPAYWLLVLLTLANAGFTYGLMAWLPQYLVHARHFSLKQMGTLASLPFLAQVVSILIASYIEDKWRRAPVCLIGYIGTAICIYMAVTVRSDLASAWLIIAATFFVGAGNLTAATIAMTVVPRQIIASGTGLTSGLGVLFSSLVPLLMGAVVASTGNLGAGMDVLVADAMLGVAVLAGLTAYGY